MLPRNPKLKPCTSETSATFFIFGLRLEDLCVASSQRLGRGERRIKIRIKRLSTSSPLYVGHSKAVNISETKVKRTPSDDNTNGESVEVRNEKRERQTPNLSLIIIV